MTSPRDAGASTSPPTKHPRRGIRLKRDFAAVKAAAQGRWPWLLQELGVDADRLKRDHGPCPGCGGTDRFRFDNLQEHGTWYCSTGGGEPAHGDGFELLCHVHGWSHAEALQRVAELLNLDATDSRPAPPPPATAGSRRDAQQAEKHARAARRAADEWARAKPASADHPYLTRKGVLPFVARVDASGRLLLPVYGADGAMQSLERISADGTIKKALPGGRMQGGYCEVQPSAEDAPTAITEGYADACSIAMAMPTWRVICAYSSGQVPAVAALLRAQAPDRPLLAAVDHDEAGTRAAARALKAAAALPLLPPEPGQDWNDYHQSHGLVGLRKALEQARHENSETNTNPLNPLNPLDTGSQPSRNPLAKLSQPENEEEDAELGDLVYRNEKGAKRLKIESKAAVIVADLVRGRLALDSEAGAWLLWCKTHWEPQTIPAAAEKLLADVVDRESDPLGFKVGYLNGVVAIISKRGLLPPPQWPTRVVPFANGLLDLDSMRLAQATPERALDWALPHRFDPRATCPTIKAWLRRAVADDAKNDDPEETVELLRAWLAALVRGLSLQVFLVLIGRGGSGKGTFQRLAAALVGLRNTAISTIRDLEENRFETAKLYGKRLCMINEAGRYNGKVDMLKAITGGDYLPLERKNVQQTGSFVFGGLVLMATNEQLASSDPTSGLERRRLTVRFPRSATPEERAEWRARGGEEGVLHAEIPGLINWLLELPEDEIRTKIEKPPARVVEENVLGMAAGNTVADWMMEACKPVRFEDVDFDESVHWTPIGTRRERRDSGRLVYDKVDQWLYASYLTWCDEQARKPVSVKRFGDIVIDIAETLGHRLARHQHPRLRTIGIKGLRLRLRNEDGWAEDPHDWLDARGCESTVESIEPAPQADARGSRGFSENLHQKSDAEVF